MQSTTRSENPLEPAHETHAIVALHAWAENGLAQGEIRETDDERLMVGTPIEVLGGIPGETVEVSLGWSAIWREKQRRRRKPPIVRLTRIIEPNPSRVEAPCPHFGDCGGCRLQHLSADDQLAWKRDRVALALRHAGIDDVPVLPTLGMETPWNFRNQMRFAVNREGVPGLTALGTHRVIPLENCPIAHPLINATLATLRQTPNPRPQILVRCGTHTGETLIQPAPEDERAEALTQAGIDWRADGLREKLGGLTFSMRPSSFFQTNTNQAEVMARLVLANVPGGPQATIADAYCGVGTFAALLATRAGSVIAIEESASAVRDARENLSKLGITNVEVIQGKAEIVLPGVATPIDAIVLDPPRMGCARPILDAIAIRQIPRIVYVSCDPTTLARDLAILRNTGYAITEVQPLDMFPQTHHIECVATLDFVGISTPEN